MQELLTSLQRRSSPPAAGDLRRMLQALSHEKDIWQAAGACERPFPQFVALVETLRELGYLRVEGRALEVTPAGHAAFERWGIALAPPVGKPCPHCAVGPAPLPELQKKFAQIAQRRPSAAPEFEQGFLTADSVMRRVSWIARCGDLTAKEVVLLGDDDLLSIALALTDSRRIGRCAPMRMICASPCPKSFWGNSTCSSPTPWRPSRAFCSLWSGGCRR